MIYGGVFVDTYLPMVNETAKEVVLWLDKMIALVEKKYFQGTVNYQSIDSVKKIDIILKQSKAYEIVRDKAPV